MGFSTIPELRRTQAKNRVQFFKGAIVIILGLTLVVFFIESLPQSKYNSVENIFSRTKRETENTNTEKQQTKCGGKFIQKFGKNASEAKRNCYNSLTKDYGKNWMKTPIDYDCVYWCDSTDYPASIFNVKQRKYGWFLLYLVGLFYMFLALAIVCDDYFVPALEKISERLNLSDDVAGATFMAAGGSTPELFTSLIGAFTNSSVGIGTIVGSAVFNILFVLGACAFVVGFKKDDKGNPTVLNLSWFPLTRDVVFYVLSLGILMFGFSGDEIVWWEACLMVFVYVAYVVFMMFNEKIEDMLGVVHRKLNTRLFRKEAMSKKWAEIVNAAAAQALEDGAELEEIKPSLWDKVKDTSSGPKTTSPTIQAVAEFNNIHDDVKKWYLLDLPNQKNSKLESICKIIALPLNICMQFTIPNNNYKSVTTFWRGYAPLLGFIMSIFWISAFSWLMVWWATRIGETWNIEPALMGLTILAAGTSVPDLLTTIIVARKGQGEAAVSSSIGSNIFDVTIGLPLPWLQK